MSKTKRTVGEQGHGGLACFPPAAATLQRSMWERGEGGHSGLLLLGETKEGGGRERGERDLRLRHEKRDCLG